MGRNIKMKMKREKNKIKHGMHSKKKMRRLNHIKMRMIVSMIFQMDNRKLKNLLNHQNNRLRKRKLLNKSGVGEQKNKTINRMKKVISMISKKQTPNNSGTRLPIVIRRIRIKNLIRKK